MPLSRTLLLFSLGTVVSGSPGASARPAETPRPARIDLLRAEPRGSDVFVSFRLDGALNPELATKIEAGLETAIRYEIRLYRHNAHWLWDYHMDTRQYRVAVTYDPVTREYVIAETMDGKPLSGSTTRDFSEVARRLVSRENLLAFRVGQDDWHTNLYVQMRATFDSGYILAIIPVDSRTPWKESNRLEIRRAP